MKHPLEKFHYCPVCGSERFEVNNVKSKKCRVCGFTYYMNPSAATVAVIIKERETLPLLLCVRRAKEPARGTLDLPGGFSDMGETSEEGVAREVLEETGLHVVRTEFLFSLPNRYVYSGLEIPTMDMFYRCEVAETRRLPFGRWTMPPRPCGYPSASSTPSSSAWRAYAAASDC